MKCGVAALHYLSFYRNLKKGEDGTEDWECEGKDSVPSSLFVLVVRRNVVFGGGESHVAQFHQMSHKLFSETAIILSQPSQLLEAAHFRF